MENNHRKSQTMIEVPKITLSSEHLNIHIFIDNNEMRLMPTGDALWEFYNRSRSNHNLLVSNHSKFAFITRNGYIRYNLQKLDNENRKSFQNN